MKPFSLAFKTPALLLAPMEGVTDSPMRALLTEHEGFTHTVTEFLRISHTVPPKKVFRRHLPELAAGAVTPSGIPINFQLLGGNPERLAHSALIAGGLGAKGIDLNFGCPAPTVNRHDGGATLLQFPERVGGIVKAVRAALPKSIPLSVKIRLGWEDTRLLFRNAEAAIEAGANSLAIHGRTKAQGYAPPALWEPIRLVRRFSPIPVVANGDIWTLEDFKRCRDQTLCEHFMLGRSALANPFLACHVAKELGLPAADVPELPSPAEWRALIARFLLLSAPAGETSAYAVKRTKQWLKYAYIRGHFPEFEIIKRCETVAELTGALGMNLTLPDSPISGGATVFSSALSTTPAWKTTVSPAYPMESQSAPSLP